MTGRGTGRDATRADRGVHAGGMPALPGSCHPRAREMPPPGSAGFPPAMDRRLPMVHAVRKRALPGETGPGTRRTRGAGGGA